MDGGRVFGAGVAIGAIMMSAIGLVASGLIESPLQVAAATAPPSPSVITAAARMQVLADTVTFRGTVTARRTIDVIASAPYSQIVVTRMLVAAGQRVRPGQLVTEIDGRPSFLLQGILPAYRSLHAGDTGPDVSQLQHALERLGYLDFDQPGYFGQSTELALLLFYQHLGYSAPIYRRATTGVRTSVQDQPRNSVGNPARKPRPAAQIPDVYLPMSEVTFIPAASALVVAVNAKVGSTVFAGPVLQLATGDPIVAGTLGQAPARLVRVGMSAGILSAHPPLFRHGVVTRAGSYPSANGRVGRGSGYPIAVTGLRPLPQSLIGHQVRLTVWLAATNGPVLAVPLAAVLGAAHRTAHRTAHSAAHRRTAHGTTTAGVIRLSAGGRRTWIAVRTGISADGLVAVQPVIPGTLRPGDRVVLGVSR